jgi:hypothetical protein
MKVLGIWWETENPTATIHEIEKLGEEIGMLESRP